MRRVSAIVALLLFGFSFFAPLFAFQSSAKVPVCCRRNGQHQCMEQMTSALGADNTVAIVAPKCPMFPTVPVAPQSHQFASNGQQALSIPVYVHPASLPQTEARYRISHARSGQKRGPPVQLS